MFNDEMKCPRLIVRDYPGTPNKGIRCSTVIRRLLRDKELIQVGKGSREILYEIRDVRLNRQLRDPFLSKNLRTIEVELDRIHRTYQYSEAVNDQPSALVTFDHVWALEGWSQWISAKPEMDRGRVLILHFDAHDDLASPSLVYQSSASRYVCPISGQKFPSGRNNSWSEVINLGMVGIGSFIAPFLRLNELVSYAHVAPCLTGCLPSKAWTLNWSHYKMETLSGMHSVPRVSKQYETKINDYGTTFQAKCCIHQKMEFLGEFDSIFLDIDLDYFCNRYDDSEAKFDGFSDRKFFHLLGALARIVEPNASRIKAISIAMSPEFFPSNYWFDCMVNISDLFSEIYYAPKERFSFPSMFR